MATRTTTTTPRSNNRNFLLDNRAMRSAMQSLHNRGITLEQLCNNTKEYKGEVQPDFSLIITLSAMKAAYYRYYTGDITNKQCKSAVNEAWERFLNPQSNTNHIEDTCF